MYDETLIQREIRQTVIDLRKTAERLENRASEIPLLISIANGEKNRDIADEEFLLEVMDLCKDLLEYFFSSSQGSNSFRIPSAFWVDTSLGQLLASVIAWVEQDQWFSYAQAARVLFPGEMLTSDAAVARLRRLLEKGNIIRYIDPAEPNPQHASRVSRQQVQALLEQQGEGRHG